MLNMIIQDSSKHNVPNMLQSRKWLKAWLQTIKMDSVRLITSEKN